MTDLRLAMNELTFDRMVELGRSLIPTLAPGWTDHNAHDPGIMLMELMAWIAEAQMYSIGRMRTDERRAYAKLVGVEAHGPQASQGLVWPYAGNGTKNAPAMSWMAGRVIAAATEASPDRPDAPVFYVSSAVQLTTAQLVRVETRFATGFSHDWTRVNAQESATYMPFGDAPAAGDRLVLIFELDAAEVPTVDAPLSLGFEVVNDVAAAAGTMMRPRALRVSLTDANGERDLDLITDTTLGLLRAGVLLLPTGGIVPVPPPAGITEKPTFAITLRSATGGFARPPRVRRIGANVVPVTESHQVVENVLNSLEVPMPGLQFTLAEEGLEYLQTATAVTVSVAEDGVWTPWSLTDDLSLSGPGDRNFEFDVASRTLTFGNGVNGRLVPEDSELQFTYRVNGGSSGNLPSGVSWSIHGLAGPFGVNREITSGGQDDQDLAALQTLARQRTRHTRPLVTTSDVEQMALSFLDLGVKRALELPPDAGARRTRGSRILLVVGPHDDDGIAATMSSGESREFLDAVRSRIAPLVPVGQRFDVMGAQYVPVRITASLVAVRNTDPKTVQDNALKELTRRLAVVTDNGLQEWQFGRGVTLTAVKGWLRRVDGVARVMSASLFGGSATTPVDVVSLRRTELPMLQIAPQDITVLRPDGSAK